MNTLARSIFLLIALLSLTACGATPAQDTCLPPGPDTTALSRADQGYCLLYPQGYQALQQTDTATVLGVDSLLNTADPRLEVSVEDAAGRTAADAAEAVIADVTLSLPDWQMGRSTIDLDGREAVVLDGLPGQEISRQVFVVAGDRLYRLTFTPADAGSGERYTRMEALYQTAIDSWRFAS